MSASLLLLMAKPTDRAINLARFLRYSIDEKAGKVSQKLFDHERAWKHEETGVSYLNSRKNKNDLLLASILQEALNRGLKPAMVTRIAQYSFDETYRIVLEGGIPRRKRGKQYAYWTATFRAQADRKSKELANAKKTKSR